MSIAKSVQFRAGLMLVAVLVSSPPCVVHAQQTVITITVREPSEALSMLVYGGPQDRLQASSVIVAAFRMDRIDGDLLRVGNYNRYTALQRQELLDGLEQIAIEGGAGPDALRVTGTAVSILSTIGLDPTIDVPEKREIPARLLRIYRRTDTRRSLIVYVLGDLLSLSPPEAPEIIDLLVEIATAAPHTTNAIGHQALAPGQVPAQQAIDALVNGGAQGIAAVRRLHREGLVKDVAARAALNAYAERGFPSERRGPIGRSRR